MPTLGRPRRHVETRSTWATTRLIKDDAAWQLTELKRQPGKDIVIMGSSNLTVSLIEMGLLDEVRIMVTPVVLGAGRSPFRTADQRASLELLRTRPFRSGNVLLCYRRAAR